MARVSLLLVLSVAACGAEPQIAPKGKQAPTLEKPEPLVSPEVRLVSPPTLHAGDVVTVLGQDFVDPERGWTVVTLTGTFQSLQGASWAVDMAVEARHVNPGRVEFLFEPGTPPEGFGHVLGTFTGDLRAVNVDERESTPPSPPKEVALEVGPSLLIWELEPEGMNCTGDRIARTVSGETLELSLEAIGLQHPTIYAPIRFSAVWVSFEGDVMETAETETGAAETELLIELGELPYGKVQATALINLSATDEDGGVVERTLSIDVKRAQSIAYDGNVDIIELYAPVQVSSCLPGGPNGRDVSYTGGQSESRSRSVSFSVNAGIDIWIVNLGFGIDVSASVSSDESESLSMSGRVQPNQFGVFYRQTQRLQRLGQVMRRTACGEDLVIGQASVTDWNWAPDLAVTSNGACPPPPASNLPPAQLLE